MLHKKPLFEFWFITGSQHLYGPDTLAQVARNSQALVLGLNDSKAIPYPIVWKPTLTGSDAISALMDAANADPTCAGVITWMHTFSPSQMWVGGLRALHKPLLHLHTQFGRDIPWSSIDMDFMNLNQSAHGDREYAHITARLGIPRSIVAGDWKDKATQGRIGTWARAAAAITEGKTARFARFGDNMREVAVTEGDKVAARIRFGWMVDGHGIGELAQGVAAVNETSVEKLLAEYRSIYEISSTDFQNPQWNKRLRVQARIEIALRAFLEEGGYLGFTTTFQDLVGLDQLPGLAAQRLMADGYGFGAEGDWKTAALLRASKVMAEGTPGGTSFMEDYTYHMDPTNQLVLGSHMLEICPSIAVGKPSVQIHPLGIGGKDDPARLVFTAAPGDAVNASLVEFGDRFRLILNEVTTITPPQSMPKLPVAQAIWKPLPDFTTALEGWLWSGGAHHTVYSTQLDAQQFSVYADLLGIEYVRIGRNTTLESIRQNILLQEVRSHQRSSS